MPSDVTIKVTWDEQPLFVSAAGPLSRSTEVIEHLDGADPAMIHTSSGRTRHEPLVVERGITNDRRFEQWAGLVLQAGPAGAPAFRKDVLIELFDGTGALVVSYRVLRAWPSAYQALPQAGDGADTVLAERLVLQHDGWTRIT